MQNLDSNFTNLKIRFRSVSIIKSIFYYFCKYMHLITSTWLLRLFLNRKVFLLWPIERCNRGLSGRDSPELSSFGLVGLSWLVTVSPDKIKRVINSLHIWNITLYSTIYPCCSSITTNRNQTYIFRIKAK